MTEIDSRVAAAAAYDDGDVAALDLRGSEHELLEAIMSTPRTDGPALAPSDGEPTRPVAAAPDPRPRRSRFRLVLGGVAVAAAFLAAVLVPSLTGHRDEPAPPAYGAGAIRIAAANPRILVDAPGWKVDHVEEFTSEEGEIRFVKGSSEVQVNWRAADQYSGYVKDRRDAGAPETVRVLGVDARLTTYSPGDYSVILPVDGPVFVELRVGVPDRAALTEVLGQLERVSVETWLDAMPDSVVKPGDEEKVADAMLADVPLPPGFDKTTLPTGGTNDYYQYGATVVGKVTCAWLDDFKAAKASDDREGMRAVQKALGTSRQWTVLKKMNPEGDYPEVVWEMSDDVRDGKVPPQYAQGLGCD